MTEQEICISYREAKDKRKQISILADLSELSKVEVIGILLRNGERVAKQEVEKLYKRLDVLDTQIAEREKEYRAIVKALTGKEQK